VRAVTAILERGVNGWSGRVDPADGDAGLRWHQIVRPVSGHASGGITIIGFASEEGVRRNQGRAGAAAGPGAFRAAASALPAWPGLVLGDAGDITCTGGDLEGAQHRYAEAVRDAVASGALPLGIGGGHEIALGTYLGVASGVGVASGIREAPGVAASSGVDAPSRGGPTSGSDPRSDPGVGSKSHPAAKSDSDAKSNAGAPSGHSCGRIGVLNFDAHFDLRRESRSTSGTPFLQILEQGGNRVRYRVMGISESANTRALFQTAEDRGVSFVLDDALTLTTLDREREALEAWLAQIDHLYLTVCLDVLPAATAPGVSAPAARGVPLEVLEPLVTAAARSGKLAAADIAELNPVFDIDQRTARVAARLAWTIARSVLPR
jgi:formiminoglutamase